MANPNHDQQGRFSSGGGGGGSRGPAASPRRTSDTRAKNPATSYKAHLHIFAGRSTVDTLREHSREMGKAMKKLKLTQRSSPHGNPLRNTKDYEGRG